MKRKEIISLLDGVGNCMYFIDSAEIRNTNTYAAAHLNLDRGEPDSGGEAEHKG